MKLKISNLRFLPCTGVLALLLLPFTLSASHNLAGEITYRYLGSNTVEITLTTYTDPQPAGVDRCLVDFEIWNAAGTIKVADIVGVPRQNGPLTDPLGIVPPCGGGIGMGEYLIGTIKRNIYITTYTFSGPGKFLIRYFDPARWDNIINMTTPGTDEFFLESTVFISEAFGANSSPQFLNIPLDFACTNKIWTHNPGGYDPDGDSLAYTLVPCRRYNPSISIYPVVCTGYQSPELVGGGTFTMDPETGLITWDVPLVPGAYAIAYKIEEWRFGIQIGFSYRDMVIFVEPCDNDPPIIESITDTCVKAGDTLVFDFKSWDPNFMTDSIYLMLNNGGGIDNGPFAVPVSPATITMIPPDTLPTDGFRDTLRGYITWATDCAHIRPAFYQVDFYAHDNFGYYTAPGTTMLGTHHITTIRVVGPPVTGLTATAGSGEILLNWDPYFCPDIVGYNIYRIDGGSSWTPDTVCCDLQPAAAGFTLIGSTSDRDSVTFVDDNGGNEFVYGQEMCYVITAIFPNFSESCPSEVACQTVNKDAAILTQDSVNVTDAAAGTIKISWSKPDDSLLTFFPTPWTYTLNRASGMSAPGAYTPIATGIPFADTLWTDAGLNTESQKYWYRVDLYDGDNDLISEGNSGSSIYLTLTPGDRAMTLNWTSSTPWTNSKYYIFRADAFGGPYTLLDSVNAPTHSYVDRDSLVNFEDYCYYVLSLGSYGLPDITDSLWNASQKTCDYPRDFTPPCVSENIFDTTSNCETFFVQFIWTDADTTCAGDLDHYNFYLADNEAGPWTFIDSIPESLYIYAPPGLQSISDCFGISGVDTNGNESEMIIFCFDNCPEIEMSNVFTPNGDGINDYFSPVKERSVKISRADIYDRWGKLVYTAENIPDVNRIWDGRTRSGGDAVEGVYYYHIWYEEVRLIGDFIRPALVGHVSLLR